MSSLSVLGVASDASHRITVFLAAPMLMMRRFHPFMFAVACGTSLRTAIPSSMTMFMMMQCHLSMLGSTESCRQVPMMCHVWGSDDVIPRRCSGKPRLLLGPGRLSGAKITPPCVHTGGE